MEKILITGTSSGLGKFLNKSLKKKYLVEGISRRNFYDIKNTKKIIEYIETNKFDYFINNAYQDHYQVILNYEVFKIWKNKKKRIINISSTSDDHMYGGMISGKREPYLYGVWKNALSSASKNLSYVSYYNRYKCKITNIRLGYINTKMSKHRNVKKIKIKEISKVIENLLRSDTNITELTILP